jgi:hypothetical protein
VSGSGSGAAAERRAVLLEGKLCCVKATRRASTLGNVTSASPRPCPPRRCGCFAEAEPHQLPRTPPARPTRRPADPEHRALRAALTEQLSDLRRQAERAAARVVIDWLQTLTRLQLPAGDARMPRREALLRRAADLRGRLEAGAAAAAELLEAGAGPEEGGEGLGTAGDGSGREEGPGGRLGAWPDRGGGGGGGAFATLGGGRSGGGGRLTIRLDPRRHAPGGAGAAAPGRGRGGAPRPVAAPPSRPLQRQVPPNPYTKLKDPTRGEGPHVLSREARERAS